MRNDRVNTAPRIRRTEDGFDDSSHARRILPAFASAPFDRLGADGPLPVPARVPAETRAPAERLRPVRAAGERVVLDIALSDAVRASVDEIRA